MYRPALAGRAISVGRLEREDARPVAFHVDDGPAASRGFVECLVEPADVRRTVVRVFADVVGVVHERHESRAGAPRRPLEHLLIAVRVPKREDRATADELLNRGRLSRPVVYELDVGLSCERWLTVRHAVFRHERSADDLLRRDAVDTFAPR